MVSAAVAHAGWNIASKRAGTAGVPFVFLNGMVAVALYLPVAVAAVVFSDARVGATLLLFAAGSTVLHLGYFLLLQRGYAAGDLSVVYPLARGTGPLLSVLVAVVVLGERPGGIGLLGAGLVVAGILVVGSGGGSAEAGLSPRSRLTAGAAYGLATGVLIAAYTLWDAHAVDERELSPVLLLLGAELGRAVLLAPYALRHRDDVGRVWRRHRPEIAAIAVLSPLAYLFVLIAYTMAPVSLVAPARELSIVLGSVAGWRLFHEPNPARRLAGAAVVLGGIVALAAA